MNKCEEYFSKYFETSTITTSNGTSSIFLLLSLIERGEVILPAFGYPAARNVSIFLGHTPVFVDIKENLFIDVEKIKEKITDKTRAIVFITHGGMIDESIYELKQLCEDKNIFLIEDSATCLGLQYKNKKFGLFGDYSIISFSGKTKIINASSGGLIVCNSNKLDIGKIKSLSDMGNFNNKDLPIGVGLNFEMGEIIQKYILEKISFLDSLIEKRKNLFLLVYNSLPNYFTNEEKNNSMLMLKNDKNITMILKLMDAAKIPYRFRYYYDIFKNFDSTNDFPVAKKLQEIYLDFNTEELTENHIKQLITIFKMCYK